jgi:hypothetical protein
VLDSNYIKSLNIEVLNLFKNPDVHPWIKYLEFDIDPIDLLTLAPTILPLLTNLRVLTLFQSTDVPNSVGSNLLPPTFLAILRQLKIRALEVETDSDVPLILDLDHDVPFLTRLNMEKATRLVLSSSGQLNDLAMCDIDYISTSASLSTLPSLKDLLIWKPHSATAEDSIPNLTTQFVSEIPNFGTK